MNVLMGGMVPVMALAWRGVPEAHDPTHGLFWFRMSIALDGLGLRARLSDELVARRQPSEARHDDRARAQDGAGAGGEEKEGRHMEMPPPVSREAIAAAAGISFAVLIFGLGIGIAGRG